MFYKFVKLTLYLRICEKDSPQTCKIKVLQTCKIED